MTVIEAHQLAEVIVEWLRERNAGELDDAIAKMTVGDFERMHGELALILEKGGRPPNWVPK